MNVKSFWLSGAAFLFGGTVFAATYLVPTDDAMVARSNAIVVAHATNTFVADTPGRGIETITHFNVEESIKGAAIVGSSFDLHEPGGRLGDSVKIVFGAPRFADGESVLLFLYRYPDGTLTTTDFGLGQFAFSTDDNGHRVLIRAESEIAGWNVDGSVHHERRRDSARFLDYLRGRSRGIPVAADYFLPTRPLMTESQSLTATVNSAVFSATSYTMGDSSENGQGFRWSVFPAAVNWNQGNTEPGAPGGGTTAINAAMAAWNGDAGSNVNYRLTSTTANLNGIFEAGDGVNNIVFERNLGTPFSCASGGLLGQGGINGVVNGTNKVGAETFWSIPEADVSMNAGIANCTSLFNSGDFTTALTHELGHTLGFRHSDKARFNPSQTNPPAPELDCSTDANLECSTVAVMKAVIVNGISGSLQTWDQHAVDAVYPCSVGGGCTANSSDFNKDGLSDLLWSNAVTGDAVAWFMSGTSLSGSAGVASQISPAWQIVGTGDFNQDGNVDIVWHNTSSGDVAIWTMSGTTRTNAFFLGAVPLDWNIVGVGDFNGDGKPDLVWRSTSTGTVNVWFMNGTAYSGTGATLAGIPTTWRVEVIGDFDNNGTADIVWRSLITGEVNIWFMSGATFQSSASVGTVTDQNWRIVAAGDYNNDGRLDLVWRHSLTGADVVWFMNGVNVTGSGSFATVADPTWKIVGPR